MSIAFPRVTSSFRPVNATPLPPVHWPSAFVGLFLAVLVVVSISWLAAPRHVDRPLPVAVPPLPVVQIAPTPIPAPAVTTPEPAPAPEKVKVANTGGSNLNLRAKAGERVSKTCWVGSIPTVRAIITNNNSIL